MDEDEALALAAALHNFGQFEEFIEEIRSNFSVGDSILREKYNELKWKRDKKDRKVKLHLRHSSLATQSALWLDAGAGSAHISAPGAFLMAKAVTKTSLILPRKNVEHPLYILDIVCVVILPKANSKCITS